MQLKNPALVLALSILLAAIAPVQAAPPASAPAEPGWAALLGPFPKPGSREALDDLAVLRWLQHARTRAEVARANTEVDLEPAAFLPAFAHPVDLASRPLTRALLAEARADVRKVSGALKHAFERRRPYLDNPDLHPAVPLEPSPSYPSGHATLAALWGRVLGALDPADREALRERGAQIGNDRALAGVHWPSDVEAGQRLGEAYGDAWLADPANARRVQEARDAEWK